MKTRSERQRRAMFAHMQQQTVGRYQAMPRNQRYRIAAGAAAASAGLGALRVARGPAGKFALTVAKIGILAKAISMPGKLIHFGLKAHKIGWTRRALKTAVGDMGLYTTKKGHILSPRHVDIAMMPFAKRWKTIYKEAI